MEIFLAAGRGLQNKKRKTSLWEVFLNGRAVFLWGICNITWQTRRASIL